MSHRAGAWLEQGGEMVTVGTNYEVREGQESAFERQFERIVAALNTTEGHVRTVVYKSVVCPRSYLALSEWKAREAFETFIDSDALAMTTPWGTSSILATRPTHEVFEHERAGARPEVCAHGAPRARTRELA